MQLFVSLAHLIQAHNNVRFSLFFNGNRFQAVTLQNYVVKIILPYIDRPVCATDALTALENIVGTRNEDLFVIILLYL